MSKLQYLPTKQLRQCSAWCRDAVNRLAVVVSRFGILQYVIYRH